MGALGTIARSFDALIGLPFWPYVKLLFCMWLVLPIFNGAAYLYENVVRKYIKIGGYHGSNYSDSQKRVLESAMSGADFSLTTRGRLGVLSAHLAAAIDRRELEAAPLIEASCTLAQNSISPPGNLKGTLTVVDERTGRTYQVAVSEEGTVKATDLKKDPGYLNTAPVRSSICYIDGDAGILRYRGYPIEELAESSSFVEVAYLLMYGNLPSQSQLADWEFAISQHSAVSQGILDIIHAMPHDAHPMGVLVSAMSALSVFHPDANPALRGQDIYKSKQVRDKQIARILGKVPTIAAAAYLRLAGRPPVLPSNSLSYAENFLYMLDSLLPFWPYVKLLFCMWLVLPIFNGAAYLYENVVRKYIKIGGYHGSNYSDSQKRVLESAMSGADFSLTTRGRLGVLSAHLAAAIDRRELEAAPLIEASCTLAQNSISPPGNLKGTLTVVDERTGRTYQVAVSEEGTVKATDLKKDPGYLNTAPVRSSICYIDGDAGILRYRGYPIEELAESSSFVEVAYLLMYGNLPSQSQLADWEFAISQHSAVSQGILDIIHAMPHDAHPMGVLVSAMSALSVFHPDANPALRGQDIYKSKQVRDKQIARILGKVPIIAAAANLRLEGRPPVLPSNSLSYAENFLYMLDSLGNRSYKPNPRLARVLDVLFILHAEHEMNCSTTAARHLASSGVDVYTALAGVVGALYGPLHGGANEAALKMLNEIGSVDKIPEFIEGVKNRKWKMSGFGHRVYKNYDPRAKVIRKLAEEVFSIVGRDPLIEVAVALEKAALADEYFVKRKLYPNVDFYSGLIYRAMGFPTEFFPVLFAIPRMAGYLAHWRESLDDPDTKIMRPQQMRHSLYFTSFHSFVISPNGRAINHSTRDYMPLKERMITSEADRLGQVSISNASRRRLAGSGV
ncbi:hypothetical protein CDL15_Pgr001426 [Punica granatum]|uniref:Citrate synthase n=2 Tax=Punica granatum TaxID=22663 RepID=A0A218WMS7_PUNGR|nr:hypothetical protein CDL15_Pgr001426 [Punica granatum]